MILSEKVLCLHSQGDGPWVKAKRVREIVIRGASDRDVIRIEFRGHHLTTDPEPLVIRGSKGRTLNYPDGELRVSRLAGKEPITVLAMCERIGHGTEATARHYLRRRDSAQPE